MCFQQQRPQLASGVHEHATHKHTVIMLLLSCCVQASSAYTAGPQHAMFSLSLSSIYKQDVLSSGTDFLRVDGVPVSRSLCLCYVETHLECARV